MSNELATMNFPVANHMEDAKAWGDVVTAASYLPYISLYGGNSNAAKEGKIGIGCYGLVRQKDKIEDLTKEFECLPLSLRFKAMQILDGNIISQYNPKSAAFAMIQEKAAIKDSGCMYGIEFLFWVPNLPAQCFATFYCNSKTSRREAPNIRGFCPSQGTQTTKGHGPIPMILKSHLIKTDKYTWHGPVATPCSTQIANLPSVEEMMEQVNKFVNPKDSEVEVAAPTDNDRAR